MTDRTNSRAEDADADVTVVGELNPRLMRRALRSDPPPTVEGAGVADALVSTTLPKQPQLVMPPPPSHRLSAAPVLASDAEETTVLPAEQLRELKGSLTENPTVPSPPVVRSVILSEPAPPLPEVHDDEATVLWQKDQGHRAPVSRSGSSATGGQAIPSYEVTTARALRLRQAQASQRSQALVFGMGMVVGGLAATVILLAVLLSLVFVGRVQFLGG